MPPALVIQLDAKAFRHLGGIIVTITHRTRLTGGSAVARVRAFPRALRMGLADPAAAEAARAALNHRVAREAW
jgi:hypothetical protein